MGGSNAMRGLPSGASVASMAKLTGSCSATPACGAPNEITGLPCQVAGACVHTTLPSKLPRLPELLRW